MKKVCLTLTASVLAVIVLAVILTPKKQKCSHCDSTAECELCP